MNMEGEQQALESGNMMEGHKKTFTVTHTGIPSAWSETGHRHLHRLEKQVINWCENTHQTCVMGVREGWILLTQYTRSRWSGEDKDRRNGGKQCEREKKSQRGPCLVKVSLASAAFSPPSLEKQLMDLSSPTTVQNEQQCHNQSQRKQIKGCSAAKQTLTPRDIVFDCCSFFSPCDMRSTDTQIF